MAIWSDRLNCPEDDESDSEDSVAVFVSPADSAVTLKDVAIDASSVRGLFDERASSVAVAIGLVLPIVDVVASWTGAHDGVDTRPALCQVQRPRVRV